MNDNAELRGFGDVDGAGHATPWRVRGSGAANPGMLTLAARQPGSGRAAFGSFRRDEKNIPAHMHSWQKCSAAMQVAEPLPQSGLRLTAIRNLNRRERARLFRLIRLARSLSPLATRASLTSRGSLSYQHPGDHRSPLRRKSNATVQAAEPQSLARLTPDSAPQGEPRGS